MTSAVLDISGLPFERHYRCTATHRTISLSPFLASHKPAVEALATAKLIKQNDSFGFAMAAPQFGTKQELCELWDDPERFVWFVGGWGPQRNRYIANAVRKMRAMLRSTECSTLFLRFNMPRSFQDVVKPADTDTGTYPWGDFSRGGAAIVQMGELILAGATSCLSEIEDDIVTRLILGNLGQEIILGNNLLPN